MRAVDTQIKAKTNDMLFSYRTKVTMELARAEDELAREKAKLHKFGLRSRTFVPCPTIPYNKPPI